MPARELKGGSALTRSARVFLRKLLADPGEEVLFFGWLFFGSPTASELTCRATDMYRSSSAGEMDSTSAMLSKSIPGVIHGQRQTRLGIQRQRITNRVAVLYPIQAIDRRPTRIGIRGRSLVQRSSNHAVNDADASALGRGSSGGGISPARTLRSTFHDPAAAEGSFRSSASNAIPAVLFLELWHPRQY